MLFRSSYRSCVTCRIQSKNAYQRKLQQKNAEAGDQISIELTDLYEFLSEILDKFENIADIEIGSENQENVENHKFTFFCIVNIAILEGNSKEKANHLIQVLSNINEYTWM